MLYGRILQISFGDLIASSIPRSSLSISNPRRGGDGHKVFALLSSAQHGRGDPKSRNGGKLPHILRTERRKITPSPKRRNGGKSSQILKDGIMVHTSHSFLSFPLLYHSGVLVVNVSEWDLSSSFFPLMLITSAEIKYWKNHLSS